MKQSFIIPYLFCCLLFLQCKNDVQKPVEPKPIELQKCLTSSRHSATSFKEKSSLNFIVTADPQYDRWQMDPDGPITKTADRVSKILKKKVHAKEIEGIIIAGDMTHNACLEELERYKGFIKGIEPFVYEGLGNHDYRNHKEEFIDFEKINALGYGDFLKNNKNGWTNYSLGVFEYLKSRKRQEKINTEAPNINYSWDWKGIHFVQLNLFPGNEPVKHKPVQHPFGALDFLKKDLKQRVGDSGKPVVLIHHYGIDKFSRGEKKPFIPNAVWWYKKQQKAYWEVIDTYNVVCIFSGHAHDCIDCDSCYLPWDGESFHREDVQKQAVPTFIAGAARDGYYLNCTINNDSLTVTRYHLEQPKYQWVVNFSN